MCQNFVVEIFAQVDDVQNNQKQELTDESVLLEEGSNKPRICGLVSTIARIAIITFVCNSLYCWLLYLSLFTIC